VFVELKASEIVYLYISLVFDNGRLLLCYVSAEQHYKA